PERRGGEGDGRLGGTEPGEGLPHLLVQRGERHDPRERVSGPRVEIREVVRIRGACGRRPVDDHLEAWPRDQVVLLLRGTPSVRVRATPEEGSEDGTDGRSGRCAIQRRVGRSSMRIATG